jgi:hypothetical protein
MSSGSPTKLVRDRGVESYEEPPDSQPSHPVIRIEPAPGSDTPADTVRVDGVDPDLMPSISEIDDAEKNLALSGWRGPLTRSKSASKRKTDHRFVP